jgi:plastocyanin
MGRSSSGERIDAGRTEAMKALVMAVLVAVAATVAMGMDGAWAQAKVTVTREENKPKSVEVKAGQEVQFINQSGGNAHVWFAGNDAVKFYVGTSASRIKFDKPGTYEYTVHVSGTKSHSHTGSVVVK